MNPLNAVFINPLNIEELFDSPVMGELKNRITQTGNPAHACLLTNSGNYPPEFLRFYETFFGKLGMTLTAFSLSALTDDEYKNVWMENSVFVLTEAEIGEVVKRSSTGDMQKTIKEELAKNKLLICFNDGCFFLCPQDLTLMQPSLGLVDFQMVPAPPNPMLVNDFFKMNPGVLHLLFADRGSALVISGPSVKVSFALKEEGRKYFAGLSVYKKDMAYPLPLESDNLSFLV